MNSSSYKAKNTTPANGGFNQMKYEIASELGVNLGPDATARQNGTVGGEITRRLVSMAQSQLGNK
ncbi:MAG: alpha/beta-type small acid-soluble spore protein [Bacilli bacterium]|nr:alpha/beta-type small acid-soluble spore protein [Bacilli bacterium]MDD7314872.1 alpha/beta-type small acid-soluble spore protein [Bacilli bacterium]MDY4053234.1 alpha/beta-type small acid-soluble spore protein [Bacilli bacterium]